MGRISHHLKGKDYKKTHQRCLDEQRALYLERREKVIEEQLYLEEIERLSQPYKSDWRSDINEGMTSSGVFFSTLPATGDADISSVDVANSSNYSFTSNATTSGALSLKLYGTTPQATFNTIDTSRVDTVSFSGYAASDNVSSDLKLFWYNYDNKQYGEVTLIPRSSTSRISVNVNLPLAARGPRVEFIPYQSRTGGADLVGRNIPIGAETTTIPSGQENLIASLLTSPGAFTALQWGKILMNGLSRNPDPDSIYFISYPGWNGPVSGNIGDENIRGYNSDLVTLQNNDSAAFTSGYLSSFSSLEIIDLFADTDMDATALNSEIFTYNDKSASKQIYYSNYVEADIAGNTASANYWLGLYNNIVPQVDAAELAVRNRINNASPLPDTRWTDADFEKLTTDIYNLYVNASSYTITGFSTKRRTPVNVFVGLSEPEATNFIRTDPIMKGLSADERRKKLEDMLDSGDEYLLKQVGLQGSAARPADTGNVQSWEQAADNEIAQLSPSDYNQERQIDQMLLKGLQRGDYGTGPAIDKQIQNILKNMQQRTPGGLPRAQADQDTQIAATPQMPSYVRDSIMRQYGKPGYGPMTPEDKKNIINWQKKLKQATGSSNMQVASYEPQGQVLSEKKLKSPKEVMNKIPGYYDGKPAPLGFPDNPPPTPVNGFHPDLVDGKKVADRFNRLDPQSAQAMPPTGNPHIDKKVRAAAKKPK